MPTRILLDTDIGSDIDDAVCLAYLLSQPECDLVGITTVTGEPEKRAMLASVLCKVAGKAVPILPGTATPLLVPQHQPDVPQAVALRTWDHDRAFPRGQAVEFMRHVIRENPGDVVLLAIGPLTNVALLFGVDPEIPALLKGLVLMCGVFTNRLPGSGPIDPREWNARCDPHATAMVYRAAVRTHRSVGLDVTCQVTMDAAAVREQFQTRLLRPVLDFAEVWFRQVDTITFHDPLAAATIFDERICGFERGLVEVELTSEKVQGLTYWTPDSPAVRHEVALEVDSACFFEHFFGVVG